jgi:hypothetical protein
MKYCIALVHGTFARGAAWTHENSLLCEGIRKGLSGSVEFHQFVWSGKNSTSARQKAGKALSTYMKAKIGEQPQAAHYIIAHSHGGNIAMYALRDSELQQSLSGLICLSTPFIHVRNRSFTAGGMESLTWGAILAMSILLAFVNLFIAIHFSPISEPVVWLIIGAIMVVFVGFLFMFSWWVSMADKLREQHTQPRLSSEMLLVIRSVGDEASFTLATSQFATWILNEVSRQFANFINRWANAGYFVSFLLAPFAFLFGFLLVPLAVLIAMLLLLPFGFQFACTNLLLDIGAESTPVGCWTVVQLEGDADAYSPLTLKIGKTSLVTTALMHSKPYDDLVALTAICQWIMQRRVALAGQVT